MSVDAATIKARYPEFDSVDDARINVFIADAELEVDEGKWSDLYDRGLSALTAHFLALALRSENGGGTGVTNSPLSSKKIGDVALGFSVASSESKTIEYYNSTNYGQDYYRMVRLIGIDALAIT